MRDPARVGGIGSDVRLELSRLDTALTTRSKPARRPHVSSAAPLADRISRTARSGRLVLCVAIGVMIGTVADAVHAQHPLTTLPIGDAAYLQLEALDRAGCAPARVSAHRPFIVRDVQRAISRFPGNARCAGAVASALTERFGAPAPLNLPADIAPDLAAAVREAADTVDAFRVGFRATVTGTVLARGEFEPLWAGVRPRDEGTPPVVADARVRGAWSPSPKLVAVGELYGQTSRRNDPTVRQRALRNTSGIVDFGESYINAALGRLDVSFGRSHAAWLGEGHESIALSANGPLMDRLELGVRWRVAEARAFVGTADDVTMTAALDSLATGTPHTRFRRWLYGHVLTVRPNDALELTLGETVLASRTTSGFDLAYANPLMAYIVAQNDTGRIASDTRDNLVVFGAVRARIGRGILGGELVVDDIQIDDADRERTADQLAWRLFATAPIPVGVASSAGLEYRRVDSYTYLRDFYTDVYQSYDKPLGSVLGPDADHLRASAETWLDGQTRLSASVGRWRQGALRINQRPADGPNDDADKPYPSTTTTRPEVQSALIADLRADRLMQRVPLSLRIQMARVENAANLPAAAALYVRAVLTASYAFRYP